MNIPSYKELLAIKDNYARAWTVMNLGAAGALQACVYKAPNGVPYELSETIFGRNSGVPVISAGGGTSVTELLPGSEYVIAESDIFKDMILKVMIDNEGEFHILDDSILRLVDVEALTPRQVESMCNNRNLASTVGVYKVKDGLRGEMLRVDNSKVEVLNSAVTINYAGQPIRLPAESVSGLSLFNSTEQPVRQYHKLNLETKNFGACMYSELRERRSRHFDENAFLGKLLGEMMLALHGQEPVRVAFPLLDTMSSNIEDLSFICSGSLMIYDRVSGDRLLVPAGKEVTVIESVEDPTKCLKVGNDGSAYLVSNTL